MKLHAIWHCKSLESTEHFFLSERAGGYVLRGVTRLPLEDVPIEIRYVIDTDADWNTGGATVDVTTAGGTHHIDVEVSDGTWTIDGALVDALEGCEDIDLGWTPATNAVPMRRFHLDLGESATTRTALLRFPELVWEASEQTYTRIAENRWRYQSTTADHEIEVTPDGMVCRYGDLFWGSVERKD